jgi:hypothetical protein
MWSILELVMSRTGFSLAALSIVLVALPAAAHHSGLPYDLATRRTSDAVVKELRWASPYSSLIVTARDAAGRMTEVDLELSSPGRLSRLGWRRDIVKAGERVKVEFHPLPDDKTKALLITVTLPGGTTLESN